MRKDYSCGGKKAVVRGNTGNDCERPKGLNRKDREERLAKFAKKGVWHFGSATSVI
jgi:hypothetical protein